MQYKNVYIWSLKKTASISSWGAFIFRGAFHSNYDWRIAQENTNVIVMFLFCLIVTVLFTCGGSGYVYFKGVVVADIQVACYLLCKLRDGVCKL